MAHNISRRSTIVGGLSVAALAAAGTRPAAANGRPDLALTHVTVIDPERRRSLPDSTVLLCGDRIVAVGGHVPHGVRVLDLAGKYLIPGLWDMHMHSFGSEEISPPLNIVNGVTTVREMMGTPLLHQWRRKVEAGTLIGPRSFLGNRMIDGFPSVLVGPGETGGVFAVKNPEEARAAVRSAKDEGADFVKVYTRVSKECLIAIADEAGRLGLPILGHLPDDVPAIEGIDLGMRSIEHVHALICSTSSRDREVREALDNIKVPEGDYQSWFTQFDHPEWLAANNYSPRRAAKVFNRMIRNGTASVPTLIMHNVHGVPDDVQTDSDLNKYVPGETLGFWEWVMENMYKKDRTEQLIAQRRAMFEHRIRFVGAMHRAGVRVLAGTDTGMAYTLPGFSLHDELAMLVRAGMTPMEALRSATVEPARFMRMEHKLGSIRPGRLADLVVLDADPLQDITNSRKVHAVLTRGRVISAADRVTMLADVERAAKATTGLKASAGGGCGCHGR